jgi:hypothetical protein
MDFYILGGIGFLLAFVASFVLRDANREEVKGAALTGWSGVGQLLRLPSYVAVITGAMLVSVGTWMFLNWLPLYFHDRFHLSLALAGFSSSSMLQIASIGGAVVGGYLSDRFTGNSPSRRLLFLAIGYCSAAPFLLTFFWDAALGPINASIFLYSFIKNIGAASECPIICELAGPRLRSTGLGVFNMMNCLAGGVGVMWAGFLKRDYGLGTAFSTVSVIVAIAGLILLAGYFLQVRREHSGVSIPEACSAP